MLDDFRHRAHPHGIVFNAIEGTVLSTTTLVAALLFLLILFFGVNLRMA